MLTSSSLMAYGLRMVHWRLRVSVLQKRWALLTAVLAVLAWFIIVAIAPTMRGVPRPGEQWPRLTGSGAWCWFQDPRAVFIRGNRSRTYAGWITAKGSLQIGAFDHDAREVEVRTIKEDWGCDDHNSCSLLVLPDRRIMAFYSRHGSGGLFCCEAMKPERIDEFSKEVRISLQNRVTYSHPAYLSDERKIYVFWRGETWKPTVASSQDGRQWTEPKILVQDPERDMPNVRPYLKLVSDGASKIHLVFTDGHPRDELWNSIYYACYEKGEFYKANGQRIGGWSSLPLSPANCDIVYDASKSGVRAWVWDVAFDTHGRPVIAYTRLPKIDHHFYHYVAWDGHEWIDQEIVDGGKWFPDTPSGRYEPEPHYSGGLALDHSDPSVVWLSRETSGVHELEKWKTSDIGMNWTHIAVTKNSRNSNVRPIVPFGYDGSRGDHVLWMNGRYARYTEFSTGIRLLVSPIDK